MTSQKICDSLAKKFSPCLDTYPGEGEEKTGEEKARIDPTDPCAFDP